MAIFWADALTKFKRKLSHKDVVRIATRMAKAGLDKEPVAACYQRLQKGNWRTDWFPTEWEQQLEPSLQRISAQESRKAQGLSCRREVLANTEGLALNDYVMSTKDADLRDYWLAEKYTDLEGYDSQDRFELLVLHYFYSLLNHLGLSGLHWQQFNGQVDIDAVVDPFRAICGMYVEELCKTMFAKSMLEIGRDDVAPAMTAYLETVSDPLLFKLRDAKDEYAAWIGQGKTDGIDPFRSQFKGLLSSIETARAKLATK